MSAAAPSVQTDVFETLQAAGAYYAVELARVGVVDLFGHAIKHARRLIRLGIGSDAAGSMPGPAGPEMA